MIFLFSGEIILGLSSKDVFWDGTGRWTARNGVKVYIKEYGAISLATSFALEKYYSKATEDEKLKMWWVNIKRFRIETDGGSLSGVSSISSQPVSEGTVQGNGGSQSRWPVEKCQGCIFLPCKQKPWSRSLDQNPCRQFHNPYRPNEKPCREGPIKSLH